MNQQNRLALVLTGLSTFLLGAGSYWLAFDRPGELPPGTQNGSVVDRRNPQAEKPLPKVRSRPEKRKPKSDEVERQREKKKKKQAKVPGRKKGPGRPPIVKIKKSTPPAG